MRPAAALRPQARSPSRLLLVLMIPRVALVRAPAFRVLVRALTVAARPVSPRLAAVAEPAPRLRQELALSLAAVLAPAPPLVEKQSASLVRPPD